MIVHDVDRIADSCGYAVPRYDHVGDREVLYRWVDRKTDGELRRYRRASNATSVDGVSGWRPGDEPLT